MLRFLFLQLSHFCFFLTPFAICHLKKHPCNPVILPALRRSPPELGGGGSLDEGWVVQIQVASLLSETQWSVVGHL